MSDARLERVRRIVADVLRETFGSEARFGPIYMSSTVDFDGMEYAMAHAVYEAPDDHLDVQKMLAVFEPLNDRVRALGETAVPVLAYVAKHEEAEWLGDRTQPD